MESKSSGNKSNPPLLKILSAVAPIVSGLLIALVGWYFTNQYQHQQFQLAEIQAIEKFSVSLKDSNEERRVIAMALLLSLDDQELAFRTIGVLSFPTKVELYSRLLISAIESKDIHLIRRIMSAMPVSYLDKNLDKFSPLETAVIHKDFTTTEFLLLNGFRCGLDSSLSLTAANGSLDIFNILLKYGADPEVSSRGNDATPFLVATEYGNIKIMTRLFELNKELVFATASDENSALSIVLNTDPRESNYPFNDLIKFLLSVKVSPIDSISKNKKEAWETGLLKALQYNRADSSTFVLLFQTASNSFDNFDNVLPMAVSYGRIDVVRFLLDSGVSPDTKNEQGNTSLFEAVGNLQLTRLLISKKADVNAKNARGETILNIAIDLQGVEVIEELIKAGVDVNQPGVEGLDDFTKPFLQTPLNEAAIYDNAEIPKILLDRGAKIDVRSGDFAETPLIVATRFGLIENVKLLLSYGANKEIKDRFDHDALYYAKEGVKDMPKTFLELVRLLN